MEKFTNEQGVVQFRSSDNTVYNEDQVVHSLLQDKYILRRFALFFRDGSCVSQRYARENNRTICTLIRRYDDDVIMREDMPADYACCEDTCRWGHWDDCHHSEEVEGCYENGLPDFYDDEVDNCHIAGYSDTNGTEIFLTNSVASVGYEIEKTHFAITTPTTRDAREHGDYVGDFDIFRGFERDGSCGVEAITHILPAHEIHADVNVYELMEVAADVINSPVNKRCGGHFTVSYDGLSASVLLTKLREYIPIFYGMYPGRLKNSYCSSNAKLSTSRLQNRGVICGRRNALEVRLPAGVKDLADLWFRHRIICKMMQHAFVLEDSNLDAFITDITPLLSERYSDDEKKSIIHLAKAFNGWIIKDEISIKMADYVEGSLSRESRLKFDAIWARYVRMIVSKRNFRKPLKLGGHFYVQLQTGRKRVTLTHKGLAFKNTILDLCPASLTRGTCTNDGVELEWTKVNQNEYQFVLTKFTREPRHMELEYLWRTTKSMDFVNSNGVCTSYMEGDTFSQTLTQRAHALGTTTDALRKLYGQTTVRVRYNIRWDANRPTREAVPEILTPTI